MSFTQLKKQLHWEYWPPFMFYLPVVPYALYLAAKARSFGFFSAVNPAIDGSGNGLESKFKTIQLLPKEYKPTSLFVEKKSNLNTLLKKIEESNLNFPLIIKPDIGFRGLLVKKIDTVESLKNYIKKYNSIDLIIQEFINYKNECGIFFHRLPHEKTGKITSITLKKYLSVNGDGKSTLLELIGKDKRAKRYVNIISDINKTKLNTIPKEGEKVVLNIIGNHSKGTQFINGNNLITKELTSTINNAIHKKISGWYFGRIDLKYNSFEELIDGKNFKIIEINGIISEPTHIYDPSKGTYLKALKSIKDHWFLIYKIGVQNHKLKIGKYTNFKFLFGIFLRYKKYMKTIKKLT